MYKPSNKQKSLLECQHWLPSNKVERLKKSWAEPFRKRVLPLIDEDGFRDAFSDSQGRPNKSIRLLVGLHLLKETNDFTDEQVLEELEFNLQWQYALGVEPGIAHVCQKTLHNFRERLLANDRAKKVFNDVTSGLAKLDGINIGCQRLDSTHVISNMAVLTRLGLFVETVTNFLKSLRKSNTSAFALLDKGFGERYLDREGYFSDVKRKVAQRRLPVVAKDIYALLVTFENDDDVKSMPAFKNLQRLFKEQCEIVSEVAGHKNENTDESQDIEASAPSTTVILVKPREPGSIPSGSLQSPHDPDATYGHKGKGYEVQIAETCDEENPYQIITATSVNGANQSDQNALIPTLDQLEESNMLPNQMLADTGYGSGSNIIESAERGVDLHAPVQDPKRLPPKDHFQKPIIETGTETNITSESAEPAASKTKPSNLLGLEWFNYDPCFNLLFSCPNGKQADDQHIKDEYLVALFSAKTCAGCLVAAQCPTRKRPDGSRLYRQKKTTIATKVRQAKQRSSAFKERYRIRSGVESTNQELKSRHGLGNIRVRGKPKVALLALMKSLALNVKRSTRWRVLLMANPDFEVCPV
jgi:Transposase DDE domain/Transposase domain (DUF772)